jgi:diadenosine tetraphosphatase ApaH/serine/threonine PP2A family protein phosphatase
VDGILCLGDTVGYGADPGPVVERLAERSAVIVAGNHDHAAAGKESLDWFNDLAREAVTWTAETLAPDQLRYLGTLPRFATHAGAVLAHASPADPGDWPYVVSARQAAEAFRASPASLAFIGHSHVPGWFTAGPDGRVTGHPGRGSIDLVPGHRYLVNVGSVGQPRDGDPWSAYVLWDAAGGRVEFRRVAYDAGEARRRILAAGLPPHLGERLLRGR